MNKQRIKSFSGSSSISISFVIPSKYKRNIANGKRCGALEGRFSHVLRRWHSFAYHSYKLPQKITGLVSGGNHGYHWKESTVRIAVGKVTLLLHSLWCLSIHYVIRNEMEIFMGEVFFFFFFPILFIVDLVIFM